MTAPDPALAKALDHLSMQVNPDNVLAVHKVFHDQADDLQIKLMSMTVDAQIGLCGGDPISVDAARAFNGKIGELLKVHWAHQDELRVAAEHVKAIARSYGITEDEITTSLSSPPEQS